MDTATIQAALMAWFTEYGELGDLCAERDETQAEDPTLDDAILDQMEACISVAAKVITVLGRQLLDTASADPADPASVTASDGTEYVKPPF